MRIKLFFITMLFFSSIVAMEQKTLKTDDEALNKVNLTEKQLILYLKTASDKEIYSSNIESFDSLFNCSEYPMSFKTGDEWAKSLALMPRLLSRGALLYLYGCHCFKEKRYDKALFYFKKTSVSAEGQYSIALCHLHLNNIKEALTNAERANKQQYFKAGLLLGILHHKQENYKKALSFLSDAYANEVPGSKYILRNFGYNLAIEAKSNPSLQYLVNNTFIVLDEIMNDEGKYQAVKLLYEYDSNLENALERFFVIHKNTKNNKVKKNIEKFISDFTKHKNMFAKCYSIFLNDINNHQQISQFRDDLEKIENNSNEKLNLKSLLAKLCFESGKRYMQQGQRQKGIMYFCNSFELTNNPYVTRTLITLLCGKNGKFISIKQNELIQTYLDTLSENIVTKKDIALLINIVNLCLPQNYKDKYKIFDKKYKTVKENMSLASEAFELLAQISLSDLSKNNRSLNYIIFAKEFLVEKLMAARKYEKAISILKHVLPYDINMYKLLVKCYLKNNQFTKAKQCIVALKRKQKNIRNKNKLTELVSDCELLCVRAELI